MSLLVFFSYRQGLKDGRAVKEEKPLEPVKPKINDEMKRMNTIIDNINNYNGGPSGQREVK
jgi:hypothetical protein